MNVTFVTYPMAFHIPGGGEIQLLALYNALNAEGLKVNLFNQWKPELEKTDIVHFFSGISGSYHFCKFIKDLNKKLFISSSLWINEENLNILPIDEIRNQFSLADKIITNSLMESKNLAKNLQIDIKKFSHIYNGFPLKFIDNTIDDDLFRNKYNINCEFILNVANIEERKNQILLASACKELNKTLILIGKIRCIKYLNEIKRINSKVIVLDYIPHSDMLISAYKAAKIFCMPSKLETPGLAALEAAATGCPIVITKEGSTIEYFGKNALYINHNSTQSIIDSLDEMDKNPITVPRTLIKKFLWKNCVKKLIKEYKI